MWVSMCAFTLRRMCCLCAYLCENVCHDDKNEGDGDADDAGVTNGDSDKDDDGDREVILCN